MSFLARSFTHGSFFHLLNGQLEFFRGYLLPVLSVVLALQANWLIEPHVTVLPPFLTFLAAIMLTAWYSGFRPAMFAVMLSVITINYYFIDPRSSFTWKPGELVTIMLFVLEGLGMAYCIDYLRKNEDRLRQTNGELEQQVTLNHQQLTEKEERLRSLLSELAVTEERERRQLAAELHDYLAQLLTVARMKVRQAQQCLFRSVGDSSRFMGETDELLHKSLDYVRTLMAELYPVDLYESGLPAGLRWLATQMPRHGLTVDLSIQGDFVPLADDQAVLLYQAVRELLMNVVKHAAVDRAEVCLEADSDKLVITVKDAGRGFPASALTPTAAGEHFGLANMRHRIATLGGTFNIESPLGRGAIVTVSVPLQSGAESKLLRAANSTPQDRVKAKPPVPPNQESLPL